MLKKILLGSLLIPLSSYAQSSVKVDLNAQAQIHVLHVVEDADKDIIGRKDPVYTATNTTNWYHTRAVQGLGSGQSVLLAVKTGYADNVSDANNKSKPHYSVNVSAEVSESLESTEMKVKIEDSLPTNNETRHYRNGGCCHNYTSEKLQSYNLTGEIAFEYEVPQNILLVRVTTSAIEKSFKNIYSTQYRNADSSINENTEFVWVKPGSKLIRYFNFTGAETYDRDGSIAIKFDPVKISTQSDFQESLNLLLDNVTSNRDLKLNEALDLLQRENLLRTSVLKMKIEETQAVLESLRSSIDKISLDHITELSLNTRAALSLLMFKISSIYSNSVLPYCTQEEVVLPYTNEKITTSKLKFSHYIISRAAKGLEGSYSFYSEFLNLIKKKVQSREFSYRELVKDKELVKMIRKSFRIVKSKISNSDYRFGKAAYEIQKMKESLQLHSEEADALLSRTISELKALDSQERELRRGVLDFPYQMNKSKNIPLNVDPLIELVNHIERKSQEVVETMKEELTFLVSSEGGIQKLLSFMKYDVVNVLAQDSESSFFETLRNSYVKPEEVRRQIQIIDMCGK